MSQFIAISKANSPRTAWISKGPLGGVESVRAMKGDMTIGDIRSCLKNRLVTFRCYHHQLNQLTNRERSYHPPTEYQQKYDDQCRGTYCSPSELKIPSPKSPPTRLLNFGPTHQPHDLMLFVPLHLSQTRQIPYSSHSQIPQDPN